MYIPKEFKYKQDFPRIGYFIAMAELALKNYIYILIFELLFYT